MATEKLEFHLRLNKRNPGHVKAAQVLATVENRYKSSFIALAILHYMGTHPYGIDTRALMDVYRQSERGYKPKVPISENIQKAGERQLSEAPTQSSDKTESDSVIDKAMDFYDIS